MNALAPLTPTRIKPLDQPSEDIIARLLASKHSATTKRTYATGLKFFASYLLGNPIVKGSKCRLDETDIKAVLWTFLELPKNFAIAYLSEYQNTMITNGFLPNSINIKIASIKALVNFAFRHELINYQLDELLTLPPDNYRDTTGIGVSDIKSMIETINTLTPNGKRDYAIMRLLWDLGLRRAEVVALNIDDYNPSLSTLKIKGKGKLSKETITLPSATANALSDWLSARPTGIDNPALFVALDFRSYGNRTSTQHIYQLVKSLGEGVGTKPLSPHKIRHSSITALLDATNGNVRMAQKFSRHKSLEVLIKYDDNRQALQAEAIRMLSEMV